MTEDDLYADDFRYCTLNCTNADMHWAHRETEWEEQQEKDRKKAVLDAMPRAVEQLIEMINDDDEMGAPIKMIVIQEDKLNDDSSWVVYATLMTDNAYQYAIYITRDGQLIADGFQKGKNDEQVS